MLRCYVYFASCYPLPGSSAGKSGPELEGVRYVCLPTGVVHIKKAGIRSEAHWTTEGTGKIRKKDRGTAQIRDLPATWTNKVRGKKDGGTYLEFRVYNSYIQ